MGKIDRLAIVILIFISCVILAMLYPMRRAHSDWDRLMSLCEYGTPEEITAC
jgi:hypothetical protein